MIITDLYYKGGYKYQLDKRFIIQTDIRPPEDIVTDYITLLRSGLMILERGYAWDGPSGPAIHTQSTIFGSLPHDAGYQLIRDGHLDVSFKGQFDMLLRDLIIQTPTDGYQGIIKSIIQDITRIRAEYFFDAVDVFGCEYIKHERKVLCIKSGGASDANK